MNRLDKFETVDSGNFKIVKNYCSTCRNIYWKAALGLTQKFDMIEAVKNEVRLTYDIIVSIEDTTTEQQLLSFLSTINSFKFKPSKVWVLVDKRKELLKISERFDKRYEFVFTVDDSTKFETIAMCINRIKSSHVMFTYSFSKIDDSIPNMFEKALNEDIRPLATHSDDNLFFCPVFMYKHFMYNENPFESMNEYVKSVTTRKCDNSELQS